MVKISFFDPVTICDIHQTKHNQHVLWRLEVSSVCIQRSYAYVYNILCNFYSQKSTCYIIISWLHSDANYTIQYMIGQNISKSKSFFLWKDFLWWSLATDDQICAFVFQRTKRYEVEEKKRKYTSDCWAWYIDLNHSWPLFQAVLSLMKVIIVCFGWMLYKTNV